MAKLRRPAEDVARMLDECIRAGQELAGKVKLAEETFGYRDWLEAFGAWRIATITALKAAYKGPDDARDFELITEIHEHSAPQFTFNYTKRKVDEGLWILGKLIDKLPLALPLSEDVAGMKSLHPEIYSRCRGLFETGDYAEAVEKGFKVVRDRLRTLTTHETGSEAFGKGDLHVEGAAAAHVDQDFQDGVKFLTMAIDRFRNEKAHTADGNIRDPVRAYEYLRLSSLAMHLLENAAVRKPLRD